MPYPIDFMFIYTWITVPQLFKELTVNENRQELGSTGLRPNEIFSERWRRVITKWISCPDVKETK